MGKPLLERLGQRVRRLREERGLSVPELARTSGLSPRFITAIQSGNGNVSVLRLAALADALGTTASRLLAEAEDGKVAPRVVALLGVRGAGKSTIGPPLAKRLGLDFIELDRRVEVEAGLSLADIFAIHGEEYFRRLEVAALRQILSAQTGAVIATGGGVVESAKAWELLERGTTTVWLRATTAAHWSRVVRQGDRRPMAGRPAAKAELGRLLARREPLYRRARIRVDTTRLGVAGSVRYIASKLARDRA